MARGKESIGQELKKTTEEVKSYISALPKEKQPKKVLRNDPRWRKLNAATKKLERQLAAIDRRNAKPVKAAE